MTMTTEYGKNNVEKKKHEKKKIEYTGVELEPIDIASISQESLEKYDHIAVYTHDVIGKCVLRSSFMQNFGVDPNHLSTFIKRKLTDKMSVHLSCEEAKLMNIRISGNMRLGVRLYNEKACTELAALVDPELRHEYATFIQCVFHRDEVRKYLYQPPVEEKQESDNTATDARDVSVNIDMKGLLESFELSNQLMLEQVEASKKIANKMDSMGKAVVMLSEYIAQLVNQNAELINYIGTLQKDNTKEIPKIEIPERFKELERSHANGNTIKLNLKRVDKMPVYKKRFDEMQTYRDEIVANVPREVQNSVLSHAYTRMRDVYGVPLDTYKNEYFADTGKSAKSTLEIAHWLEFRNPVINGLLRCCVETVFPECSTIAATH